MDRKKLSKYYDCWSAAWKMFRRWLNDTDDWNAVSSRVLMDINDFTRTHSDCTALATGIGLLFASEIDVLCRSHEGKREVTAEETKPYYDMWNQAWRLFKHWADSCADEKTMDREATEFIAEWQKNGFPRFSALAIADLRVELYKGADS